LILGERSLIAPQRQDIIDVPFSQLALDAGNKLYANNVAVSAVAAILGVAEDVVLECVRKFFSKKEAAVISGNCAAVNKGYAFSLGLMSSGAVDPKRFVALCVDKIVAQENLIDGNRSIGLGALAGGCNFIAAYPMSPGTGVLTFLSAHAKEFDVVAEQAEDEISAINMALGASYAGARAMVTTSGGGFALMEEGVSLAGMIETPVVIHVAQRPGPATGLPTRTEQGDLDLVLYSGHGEFPRAIYAPGDVKQAFELTQQAFAVADQYQIPAFILSDQYLVDATYNSPGLKVQRDEITLDIVKADKDYQRYALTKSGISPRGIPGYGEGLILVDSDEHDEAGRITESMAVRNAMVEKRLKKWALLRKNALTPVLFGPKTYKNLVLSWGSTFPIVGEALQRLNRKDTAFLHFGQVYPLSSKTAVFLKKAKRVICVENNATGQFARLVQQETGEKVTDKILKYDGLPFFVDELVVKLSRVLGKGIR